VIYGALRTAYIAQHLGKNGKTLDHLIQETDKLEIIKIVYEFTGQLRYPMPLDYVERKDKENEAICLQPAENTFSNIPLPYLCVAKEHVEQINDGVLEEFQLGDYLDGNTPKVEISKWSTFITNETKFGNKRNNDSRSTSDEDGNVYRLIMRRLENKENKKLKLIIEYKFGKDIKIGLMRLGGEGKIAEFSDVTFNDVNAEQLSEKHFKMVLQTPALFENGNEPNLKWFNDKGFEVRLLTKVVGKPIKIGGWDMENKKPKPMLSATPVGSVFYYEITNQKNVQDLVNSCKSIYSISDQRQKEGFGLYKIANLIFKPIQI
jgi:CRISPR-associated protein Cmr3